MRQEKRGGPFKDQIARYRDPVRVRTFYENLCALGVIFTVEDDGRIVATGRSAPPVIQSEIDKRADILRPIILTGQASANPTAEHGKKPRLNDAI